MKKKLVFISPHFDDLCYSSLIAVRRLSAEHDVILCNVFTRSSWCPQLKIEDPEQISETRNLEDAAFCRNEQIQKRINLGFPDCMLRGDGYGRALTDGELFLKEEVRTALSGIIEAYKTDLFFVPLSIGNNIDHVMVLETFLSRMDQLNGYLFFYEDLPYSNFYSISQMRGIVEKKLGHSAACIQFPVSFRDLFSKIRAMKVYKSQTRLFDIFHSCFYTICKAKMRERVWKVS